MNFENSVTYVLTQLSVAYRSHLEKSMNEIGLHSGQVFILISLWSEDGQSQVDMVKRLSLTAPTINKMIKSLVNGGFVECRKCSSDGRLMRVFLTDKGFECKTAVEDHWMKIETQAYSNLTDTEKLVLTQLFLKLKDNLTQNNLNNSVESQF